MILVFIGLGSFIWPFSTSVNLGLVWGVVSGLFDGTANGLRKDLSGKIDKFILVSITAVGGVVVSGFMINYSHQNISFVTSLSLTTWLIGLLFGFLLVFINYLLLVGFQNFDLSLGSIVLAAELIFASLFGYVLFKEIPAPKEIFGGFLISLAVILPNFKLLKRQTST